MDLLLNPTNNDIIWNNGPLLREFTTQPLTQTVGQRLKIRLLTFKGEWFVNTVYGIPWYQEILGKKPSKSRVDRIFQQEILAEQGVREITYFNSIFDKRQYSLEFRVKVSTGDVTEVININLV